MTDPISEQAIVLHHVPTMSGDLQVAFTPAGPGDTFSTLTEAKAQLDEHNARRDEPITSDRYMPLTHVALDAAVWSAMGEPDTITVLVRPGNVLDVEHGLDDLGPVAEVQHMPGKGDPVAVVRHSANVVSDDPRPQHDDVTSDDVRFEQTAGDQQT
jgi:hypothetical protein